MKSQDEYINKMKAKLDQLDAKIDVWKAKADEASSDVKIEYNEKIEELRQERKEGEAWLEKVSDASDDAWESIKDGFESAYERMKKALS
jgi:uncharacterized coiled-coil DUF342 family protein